MSKEIHTVTELPANLPGALTKVLPKDGRAQQTDVWGAKADGVRAGSWSVSSPGLPTEIGGVIRLEPSGDGCRQVVEAVREGNAAKELLA